MLVEDIIKTLEELAPPELAFGWDNVGLMVGDKKKNIKKVLFALDCTEEVLDEAVKEKAQLIVTHHPFIFRPLKNLDYEAPITKRILKAVKEDIAIYSAHTNLDIAQGGTNSVLFDLLSLKDEEPLAEEKGLYIGKIGVLQESISFKSFIELVKTKLHLDHLTVNGDINKKIKKIGLCTGSGGEYIYTAFKKGCDVYITGDVGYHDAQLAWELGICLIDATHYATEVIVAKALSEYVSSKHKNLECIVSKVNSQTLHIV